MNERLREPELEALAPRLPRGPVFDRVNLVLASRALARNDVAKARKALDRLPRQLSGADDAERARLLARAADRDGGAAATLGVDNSATMLASAAARATPRLGFARADIAAFAPA